MTDLRPYVGKCEHGAIRAAICPVEKGENGPTEKEVAKFVADLIRRGLSVERMVIEEVRRGTWKCDACEAAP